MAIIPIMAPETISVTYRHNIVLNLGQVSLVAVNDFHSQDVPIGRVLMEDTRLSIVRSANFMQGDGELYVSADFYNSLLSQWEPVLDRWHPKLVITTGKNGINYSIRSAHTMQVTVSGRMLQTILETNSLLRARQVDDGEWEREIVPEVAVHNLLGAPVEVEILDSVSGSELLRLGPMNSGNLPQVKDVSTGAACE